MATFFIVSWPPEPGLRPFYDCSFAYDTLRAAWKLNLLHAKFICRDHKKNLRIYSYNPYTIKAPYPWILKNTYYNCTTTHPWSLISRPYRPEDKRLCEHLDFDPTNDLGGYEIRATVMNVAGWWYTHPNKTGLERFGQFGGAIAKLLYHTLNATPFLIPISSNKYQDQLELIRSGEADIILNLRYQRNRVDFKMSCPFWASGLSALSQFTGSLSQLEKIIRTIDRPSRYGVQIVCVVTLIFFKCCLRQDLVPAILNIVRLISNTSLIRIPKKTAPRIYLAGIFIFAINIQAIYLGKLLTSLEKNVQKPNLDTIEELGERNYKIYVAQNLIHFFDDPIYEGRRFLSESDNCTGYVLKDRWATCVRNKDILMYEADKFMLHLSRRILIPFYMAHVIRRDWPLEKRISLTLRRLKETGLMGFVYEENRKDLPGRIRRRENVTRDQGFKVLTLKQLDFAFGILGVGVELATLSFFIEVWGRKGMEVGKRGIYYCCRKCSRS